MLQRAGRLLVSLFRKFKSVFRANAVERRNFFEQRPPDCARPTSAGAAAAYPVLLNCNGSARENIAWPNFIRKLNRGIYEILFIDSQRSSFAWHRDGGNDVEAGVLQRQRMLQHGMLQEIAA